MFLDLDDSDFAVSVGGARAQPTRRWGVDSEYGLLTDVMLCAPSHLAPVPCCAVTVDSLRRGFRHSAERALEQHHELARALELAGVRCHVVQPRAGLPDLAFARDATFMTPWGLLELNPAAEHRRGEGPYIAQLARDWGVPLAGRVEHGTVEGGDICLVRPGVVAIGCSGSRTSEAGAASIGSFFVRHGWEVILNRFDPHFLHLDTQFAMIDDRRALACIDVLDDVFVDRMVALGIDLVPVSYKEAMRLGTNVLSLGNRRIVASAENARVNEELTRLGYHVIALDLEQFTRCGGGVHCLTMPLARHTT